MGAGKSTLAKELNKTLEDSVWLDGDWCWMQGEKWNICEENKKMVIDNITYLLKNFLKNPNFKNVIFIWVLHLPEIWDEILIPLQDMEFKLHKFSVICDEGDLRKRIIFREEANKDGYNTEQLAKGSIERLQLHKNLDTFKLDSSKNSIEELIKIVTNKLK